MGRKPITEDQFKKLADEFGYEVKKVREWDRKTFVVEKKVLAEFLKAVTTSGMLIQDAATEALEQWTNKKKG